MKNKRVCWQWVMLLLVAAGLSPATRGAERSVQVLGTSVPRGQTNCLSIVLEAAGDENALGFSLCFDTNQLIFRSARRGGAAGGATLNVNSNQVSRGRLGCALALSSGESFPAGTNPVIEVCFQATAGAGILTTPVSFCDSPIGRELVDVGAGTLASLYSDATVTLVGTCHYSLQAGSASVSSSGGPASMALTAESGCPWSVVNTNAWITITSPTNGTASSVIGCTVAPNEGRSARTGQVAIASETFKLVQAGIPCGFALEPAIRTHGPEGGIGQVSILADTTCAWTAQSTNSWINVTSATNGVGNGTVSYAVSAFSGFVARTGQVTIAEQAFTLIQLPQPCFYSISPAGRTHTAVSEFAVVSVTAPVGCDWEIVNTNDWILIKLSNTGSGPGLARYTVYSNDRATTRTGTITIAGIPFTVTQLPAPCTYSMLQTSRLLGGGGGTGIVTFATLDDCPWTAVNTNLWIEMPAVTAGVGGGRLGFDVGPNFSSTERIGTVMAAGYGYTITQLPTDCSSSLSPSTRSVSYGMSTSSVNVTIGSACSNVQWRVYNTNRWISLLTGNVGVNARTVQFAVNPLLEHVTRTGMLYIADRKFTVTQTGPPCLYSFLPPSRSHPYNAETGSVNLTTDGPCGWFARSDSSWLVIDSATNGSGSAVLNYHVTMNTGATRTGKLTVSNQTFAVTQNAAIPVSISTQPTNQYILIGGTAAFRVSATGSAPLVYQWQCNGTNLMDGPGIVGATTTNLVLSNVQPSQGGNYAVIVSNIRGPVTSSTAALRVNTSPVLAPVADRCVVRGVPVAFSIPAVDTDLPAQKLTYSLGAGAPSGAAISSSGQFTWTPATAGGGPSTFPITVRVADNGVPPLTNSSTFSITVVPGNIANVALDVGPSNGTVLAIGDPLLLSMRTSDSNGTVARVEYSLDTNAPVRAASAPYAIALGEAPAGLHVVTARAMDACGTATTSAPNYFLVAPPGAQVLFLPGFKAAPSGLSVSGATAVLSNELFLTRATSNQSAAAWSVKKAYLADGFETSFRFRMAVPAGNAGGEGFAFLLQNSSPTALGSGGGDLGYAGISNSLAIEFDTLLGAALGDTNDNHISIHTLGTLANTANESASIGRSATLANFADGGVHLAKIDYVPGRLRVFLDDLTNPVLSVETNLASILNLDQGRAWVGFTAATGPAIETHEILAWSMLTTNLPPSVTLASPAEGASFVSPAAILLMADASDLDGTVASVEFFDGPRWLARSVGPAFSMLWSNVPPGDYVLTLRATDNLGLVSTSAPVNVTVLFVNKAPTFAPGPDQSVVEDAGPRTAAGWASAISPGPPDEAWEAVTFLVTNDAPGLFVTQPAIDAAGTLTFTPALDAFGIATVTVLLRDDGGIANNGRDSSPAITFAIRVVPVNDPPSFAKGPDQTVLEDGGPQTVPGWATLIRQGPPNESDQLVSFGVTTDNPSLFAVPPEIPPDGTLTFTAAPDMHGVATVHLSLRDDGGTANGGRDTSGPQSFTITVVPVNDSPAFTPGTNVVVLEDSGSQVITHWATDISPGPASEVRQTLTFLVSNDSPDLFAAQPAIDASGTLTFKPAPDAFGLAVVTAVLRDDGGTTNGGLDLSVAQTFVIRVVPVNDAPSFAKGLNQAAHDDAGPQTAPGWATRIRPGPANESSQAVRFELTTDNPGLFAVEPVIAPDGTLTYTPIMDVLGVAHVQVVLRDDGGTVNAGLDTSGVQSFTISVVTNLPPLVALTSPANEETFISPATILLTADASDLDGSVAAVEFFAGSNSLARFTARPFSVVWSNVPPGDYVLTACATDNRGLAMTSLPANIQVLFVNKPPSFTPGPDQTVLEDCGPKIVAHWASALSPGPADEAGQMLSFIVSNDSPGLFAAQPAIDSGGNLTFRPAQDAFGLATVSVVLRDDGGTANNGRDTSAVRTFAIRVSPVNDPPSFVKGPDQTVLEDSGTQTVPAWATQIQAGPANETGQVVGFRVTTDNPGLFGSQPVLAPDGTLNYTPAPDQHGVAVVHVSLRDDAGMEGGGSDTSDLQSFTITVVPVNDPPSFTPGTNVMILEDAGSQIVRNWATNLRRGPASEAGQTLTFVVSNDSPAFFAAQPAIDAQGSLTFTPAPDAFGLVTVSVVLRDDGGIANGGKDTSAAAIIALRIVPVNDAPSFVKGPDQAVLEDAGAQTVPGWARQIRPGPTNESSQMLAFAVTTDNLPLFAVRPALAADGTLTYTPAPEMHGVATVHVTLQDDGGTENGGLDTSGQESFTILVSPVNDPPTFMRGSNVVVLEDSGLQIMPHWAANMRAGPVDESGQTLRFQRVACDNIALCSDLPSLSPDGTLRFLPAPDAVGSTRVTFILVDDGGTDNGGQNSSIPQSFMITVLPVNDPPSFTPGTNVVVIEDAGQVVIPAWAGNIRPGPADESAQSVRFQITDFDNAALYKETPTLTPNGTLRFKMMPDAVGTSRVTCILVDDGGTANGGQNTSTAATFTITASPVNDPPSFSPGKNVVVMEDAGLQVITNWATKLRPGPTNESDQSLHFELAACENLALYSQIPSLAQNGTLRFRTAPDAIGASRVTFVLVDDGGTDNDGKNTSVAQSFTITVLPVNDPPSFTPGANVLAEEDGGLQVISDWASHILPGPADESGQSVQFVLVACDKPAIFRQLPWIAPDGTLGFIVEPDTLGTCRVTFVAVDNGGTANGGRDTCSEQSFTITVLPVNDPPSFIMGPDPTVFEDAGPQIVPGWAGEMSVGPPDEAGQTFEFLLGNDNEALFASQPAVDADGTLTFTTAPQANGLATVTVLMRDSGGTEVGGHDTSAPQTFVITVLPVNDPPTFTKGPNQSVMAHEGPQAVLHWAENLSPGPPDESGQHLTILVSNDNPGLFLQQPAIAADGTLTYTPVPDSCGVAAVTVIAMDDGGTDRDGIDTSAPCFFTISVGGTNTCPVAGAQSITVNEDGAAVVTLFGTDGDIGRPGCGSTNLTFTIIIPPVHGILTGTPPHLTYTPTPGYPGPCGHANGADAFAYIVSDDLCSSDPAMVTIAVMDVNHCPTSISAASPLCKLPGMESVPLIISPNNSNACLICDGTLSEDTDCDSLAWTWSIDGVKVFASGPVTTNCFPNGEHDITLTVNDGRCESTNLVHVEIISACEAVEALTTDINNSILTTSGSPDPPGPPGPDVKAKDMRPLLAALKAACMAYDRGKFKEGLDQLRAFQNKTKSIARNNPDEADRWWAAAEVIILSIQSGQEVHAKTHGKHPNDDHDDDDPNPPPWMPGHHPTSNPHSNNDWRTHAHDPR